MNPLIYLWTLTALQGAVFWSALNYSDTAWVVALAGTGLAWNAAISLICSVIALWDAL